MNTLFDRRQFLATSLRRALGLTAGSAVLKSMEGFTRADPSGTGYRAMVCVFLFGGNDSWNMLIPAGHDRIGGNDPRFVRYSSFRGSFASWKHVNGTTAATSCLGLGTTPVPDWSMNPRMAALKSVFDEGRMAFIANTGSLAVPGATRWPYLNGSQALPPKLFSHEDQVTAWERGHAGLSPDYLHGWGARLEEFWLGDGPAQAAWAGTSPADLRRQLSLISLEGSNAFQVGKWGVPFSLTTAGVPALSAAAKFGRGSEPSSMETLMTCVLSNRSQRHLLEEAYAAACRRANDLRATATKMIAPDVSAAWNAAVAAAVSAENGAASASAGSSITGPGASSGAAWGLLSKLKTVFAAMQGAQTAPNALDRQVFFVGLGGFDTHGGRNDDLLQGVAFALRAFYEATKSMDVLTFTCSDFGRTLRVSPGGTGGTEHAWGGTQMVIGKDVNGGVVSGTTPRPYYGSMPEDFLNGTEIPAQQGGASGTDFVLDNRGVLVPSTASAQYLASIGRWFLRGKELATNAASPEAGTLEAGIREALPIIYASEANRTQWLPGIPGLIANT